MRKRSKALACVAAAASLLAAAGCGGSGGSGKTATAAARPSGTLTIAAWDLGIPNDPLDAAVRQFEAAYPAVRVVVRKTAYPQYVQTLRLQLAANQAPDVARAVVGYGDASTELALASRGLLADLSSSPWASQIPRTSAFTINTGGKTYAYPVSSTTIGALYQPAVFARLGVTPPTTFSQVLALCRRFAGSGTIPVAMGAQQDSGMPSFLAFALASSTAYVQDPDFAEHRLSGATTFAGSAGWRAALSEFQQMSRAGCFDKGAVGTTQEAASAQVAQGRALMAVTATVTLPLFLQANPRATYAMFAFPGSDSAADVRVPLDGADGLVVPSRAKNPSTAQAFIDFYAAHRGEFAKLDQSVPAIPVPGGAQVPPYAAALAPFVKAGKITGIANSQWPNPDVNAKLAVGLVNLMQGQGSPSAVLSSMDSVWTGPGGGK